MNGLTQARPGQTWITHVVAILVLAGGFYALVPYPFVLDDLVKGAIIGFMGMALNWEFGVAVADRTARQQQAATSAGAQAGALVPGMGGQQPLDQMRAQVGLTPEEQAELGKEIP